MSDCLNTKNKLNNLSHAGCERPQRSLQGGVGETKPFIFCHYCVISVLEYKNLQSEIKTHKQLSRLDDELDSPQTSRVLPRQMPDNKRLTDKNEK